MVEMSGVIRRTRGHADNCDMDVQRPDKAFLRGNSKGRAMPPNDHVDVEKHTTLIALMRDAPEELFRITLLELIRDNTALTQQIDSKVSTLHVDVHTLVTRVVQLEMWRSTWARVFWLLFGIVSTVCIGAAFTSVFGHITWTSH